MRSDRLAVQLDHPRRRMSRVVGAGAVAASLLLVPAVAMAETEWDPPTTARTPNKAEPAPADPVPTSTATTASARPSQPSTNAPSPSTSEPSTNAPSPSTSEPSTNAPSPSTSEPREPATDPEKITPLPGTPGTSNARNATAVANNQDGRLEAVWRDSGKIMHAYQLAPNSAWSGHDELTFPLPSPVAGDPLIQLDGSGRLTVVVDTDDGTYVATQVLPNSWWSDWDLIGPDMHRPALGQENGVIVCTVVSPLTVVYPPDPYGCWPTPGPLVIYYGEAVGGSLVRQQQIFQGGPWDQPHPYTANPFPENTLDAVAFNDERTLSTLSSHVAYATASGSTVCPMPLVPAGQCTDLGLPPGGFSTSASLSAGVNDDGRAEIYSVSADQSVWHAYQLHDGSWTGWEPLFRPFTGAALVGSPQAQRNTAGTLELVMAADDGSVWHTFQTSPSGQWFGWAPLGPSGFTGSLSVALAVNQDGRLEEFNVKPGPGAQVTHAYQPAPSTGPWSPIIPL